MSKLPPPNTHSHKSTATAAEITTKFVPKGKIALVKSYLIKFNEWNTNRIYKKQFRKYLQNLKIPNRPVDGEDAYIAKWQRLSSRRDVYSYRLFSRYCGNNPNITPEGICRCKIEQVLNPLRYRPYYEDKNLYSQYMGDLNMPATYLRRIGGGEILNSEYSTVLREDVLSLIPAVCNRVILKPSVDSCSGHGVMLFERKGNQWKSANSEDILSRKFLIAYGGDFVLQEALIQHSYMAQFCKTSFNTIRISTYRSVVDGEPHILGSVLRIGHDGSIVDNAHAGGAVIGVNSSNGEIAKCMYDQYGVKSTCCNNIDFSKSSFQIPNWNKIVEFAKEVTKRNKHHHLFALDIGLDVNGDPVFIESNINGFGYWLFMFSGKTPFGEYTDEIIEYCAENQYRRIQDFVL